MRVHQRLRLSARPAFTLVELIVVIAIIAGLAALTVLIFPRLQESQRVAKGADVVQGQLFLAKQMALRDQLPRGVRLIQDSTGYVTSLQIIEQPLPYTGQGVTVNTTVPSATFSTAIPAGAVLPGDYLDLSASGDTYTTDSPHALHRITGPATLVTAPTTTVTLASAPTITSATVYRIIRSARPAVGINPVALPSDVAVDPGTSLATAPVPPSGIRGIAPLDATTNFVDILFDPSGKVLSTAGATGKVILYVYDPTKVAPEEVMVGVFSRTGSIVAQPVAPGSDPYFFIKDGSTSGM
jgi:prepilin-type N-terminal cleavage/methylation domain-containing protein